MEIVKRKGNQAGYDFYLKQDNKILKIVFGGNLDLYWNLIIQTDKITKYTKLEETFVITKENYFIYSLFEKLLNDIKTANIYEPTHPENKDDIFGRATEEKCNKWNNRLKKSYYYQELYDSVTNTISWHSDEEEYSAADVVKISKVDDTFVLKFTRPELNRENNYFRLSNSISIRFSNSGSRYDEFNIPFMRMYNELQDYDPNNHQIHLEELNFIKKLTLHK